MAEAVLLISSVYFLSRERVFELVTRNGMKTGITIGKGWLLGNLLCRRMMHLLYIVNTGGHKCPSTLRVQQKADV